MIDRLVGLSIALLLGSIVISLVAMRTQHAPVQRPAQAHSTSILLTEQATPPASESSAPNPPSKHHAPTKLDLTGRLSGHLSREQGVFTGATVHFSDPMVMLPGDTLTVTWTVKQDDVVTMDHAEVTPTGWLRAQHPLRKPTRQEQKQALQDDTVVFGGLFTPSASDIAPNNDARSLIIFDTCPISSAGDACTLTPPESPKKKEGPPKKVTLPAHGDIVIPLKVKR